jgi:hypothetical protein
MDYCSVFRGCPHVQFDVLYDDRLMMQLRPEYDKTYSIRMRKLLESMTADIENVNIVSSPSTPVIQRPLPYDLAMHLGVQPKTLKPAATPSDDRENYVVMNTKCITVQDNGLKQYWDAMKGSLFNLFNSYNTRVLIIGEKAPSACKEYDMHGTFPIYEDIVKGGINLLEDRTDSDTISLYDEASIRTNIETLKRSAFNIHIGEGGGLVVYSHCNHLVGFTNKHLPIQTLIDSPYSQYNILDIDIFLRIVEEKLYANNLSQRQS